MAFLKAVIRVAVAVRDFFRICAMCWGRDRKVAFRGVQLEPSYTMYHWDGKGKDPNRGMWLCRLCADEHKEFWKEMWQEFYYDRI